MKKIIALILLVALVGCSLKNARLTTTTCEFNEEDNNRNVVLQSREDGQIVEIMRDYIYILEQADQSVVDELTNNPLTSEKIQEKKEEVEKFYNDLVTYDVKEEWTEANYTLTETYYWNEADDLDKVSPLETVDMMIEIVEDWGFDCK